MSCRRGGLVEIKSRITRHHAAKATTASTRRLAWPHAHHERVMAPQPPSRRETNESAWTSRGADQRLALQAQIAEAGLLSIVPENRRTSWSTRPRALPGRGGDHSSNYRASAVGDQISLLGRKPWKQRHRKQVSDSYLSRWRRPARRFARHDHESSSSARKRSSHGSRDAVELDARPEQTPGVRAPWLDSAADAPPLIGLTSVFACAGAAAPVW